MEVRRSKRTQPKVNYKKLLGTGRLPRAKRLHCRDPTDTLFPVTILESNNHRVRIHNDGYDSDFDEWRDENDIELTDRNNSNEISCSLVPNSAPQYHQPFSLYGDLRNRIKISLKFGRKSSPTVKIIMPFDPLLLNGGLKCAGMPYQMKSGIQHYSVKAYTDLNHLLGNGWHFRGLNANGDYSYIVLNTIDYALQKSRSFVEYLPSRVGNNKFASSVTDTGFPLVFGFVLNYGTPSTFGTDKRVFV